MKLKNFENTIEILGPTEDKYSFMERKLDEIEEDESFYVCDLNDIMNKYNNWKRLLPRIETYYAVKCNNHPMVLATMVNLGLGFDCASKGEIKKVLALGANPEKVIFANPTKLPSHIKYAEEIGVSKMTFDDVSELVKMKKHHPKAKLILRIRFDDEKATFKFGDKYGCSAEKDAFNILKKAKELNMNVIGVSFHIGTGSQTPSVFIGAIKSSRYVFDIAEELGFKFNFLDIGGGYPGSNNSNIIKIAKCINEAIAEHFPNENEVKIISEPGSYYVESAFTLLTQIHTVKKPDLESDRPYMYYINTGTYSGLLDTLLGKKFDLKPVSAKKDSVNHKCHIWGNTLDSSDKVANDIFLPEMEVGDWFMVENAGAYTITLATDFNDYEKPKVYGIIERTKW